MIYSLNIEKIANQYYLFLYDVLTVAVDNGSVPDIIRRVVDNDSPSSRYSPVQQFSTPLRKFFCEVNSRQLCESVGAASRLIAAIQFILNSNHDHAKFSRDKFLSEVCQHLLQAGLSDDLLQYIANMRSQFVRDSYYLGKKKALPLSRRKILDILVSNCSAEYSAEQYSSQFECLRAVAVVNVHFWLVVAAILGLSFLFGGLLSGWSSVVLLPAYALFFFGSYSVIKSFIQADQALCDKKMGEVSILARLKFWYKNGLITREPDGSYCPPDSGVRPVNMKVLLFTASIGLLTSLLLMQQPIITGLLSLTASMCVAFEFAQITMKSPINLQWLPNTCINEIQKDSPVSLSLSSSLSNGSSSPNSNPYLARKHSLLQLFQTQSMIGDNRVSNTPGSDSL